MARITRYIGPIVAAAVLLAMPGCADDDGVAPEADHLTGTYTMTDWLYVVRGDTLPLTDDSYVRITFLDDEHVKGEGYAWVLVEERRPDGRVVERRLPILGTQRDGEVVPTKIEGWYYIDDTMSTDTLRFRLAKGAGAQTWIEEIDWHLSEDRQSYEIQLENQDIALHIVHTREE